LLCFIPPPPHPPTHPPHPPTHTHTHTHTHTYPPPTHPAQDFRARIRKYEDGYETIMDRTLHYIKLIDMVTGAPASRLAPCACMLGHVRRRRRR
jgi:hypothetical protein